MQRDIDLRSHFHVKLLLALFLLMGKPAGAQVGLGLVPMRVDVTLTPGQGYSNSLELTNQSDEGTHLRGQVMDFYIDNDETPQFGNYPAITTSCSSFLRVIPRDTDIGPKLTQLARYTFNPPATLKDGTYHCAIGFTTQPVPSAGSSGLAVNVQVVTAFYVTIGTPVYRSEVKQLSLEASPAEAEGTLRGFCVLRNDGEYVWRPVGELDVVTADGSVRDHVPVRSLPVLPNRDQRFLFPLKSKPVEGDTLRLRIDVGNGEVEEAHAVVSEKMLAR